MSYSVLEEAERHRLESQYLDEGIPQTVSKPLLLRLNAKGVKTIQCPKRYAYGFGVSDLEDEFSCLLDIRLDTKVNRGYWQ
jgi:hypothetical protein